MTCNVVTEQLKENTLQWFFFNWEIVIPCIGKNILQESSKQLLSSWKRCFHWTYTALLVLLLAIFREVAPWKKVHKKYFLFPFIFFKLWFVGYSMNSEPRKFLFPNFALRKKEKVICFRRGNCYFIVCSVLSLCILIYTSKKYRSFSYLDIYHHFGFVRTTSTGRLASVQLFL